MLITLVNITCNVYVIFINKWYSTLNIAIKKMNNLENTYLYLALWKTHPLIVYTINNVRELNLTNSIIIINSCKYIDLYNFFRYID